MLFKLQIKSIIPAQIIGYGFSLFVGLSMLILTIQLLIDINPILNKQTDIFKLKTAVISKEISLLKSIKKDNIYFTSEELEELKNQKFTNNIVKFNSATFKINASTEARGNIPSFYTDLFFESIPNKYLDVDLISWNWDSLSDFIPIIIPENYLNLYNFGFAESQGLPVISKNTISQFSFNLNISGNKMITEYNSRIVGFSNKINTILVPQDFLIWANKKYGTKSNKASRILVEFKDSYDENLLEFFNERNYSIKKDNLESSKLTFFFKSSMIFIIFVALIIIVLSISFVLLSFNLIIQRNKSLILNLYHLGYDQFKIARFYQFSISLISLISFLSTIFICNIIRTKYLASLSNLFDYIPEKNIIFIIGIIFSFFTLMVYNIILLRNINRIVSLNMKK